MENSYTFRITYDKNFVCYIVARTDFEAIDRAFNRILDQQLNLEIKLFNAKKLK
jgi:hypothetical protein